MILPFFFLLLSSALTDAGLTEYARIKGRVTCNGLSFSPLTVDLWDKDADNILDRHDLLGSADLDPLQDGEFEVSGHEWEFGRVEFHLTVKHNCLHDPALKAKVEEAKKSGGLLNINNERIKKLLHSGPTCNHIIELPREVSSKVSDPPTYNMGDIEVTDTECEGDVNFGKKMVNEQKKLVGQEKKVLKANLDLVKKYKDHSRNI